MKHGNIELLNMDCMELLKSLPDSSVDLMVQDPPYGITNNSWDKVPDLVALWPEWERVVKPNGTFVFTTGQPFTTDVINSNRRLFKYDLVWEKSIATGFLNANRAPLRGHEIVLIFYRKKPVFNPIKYKLEGRPSFKRGNKARGSKNYGKFTHEMDIGAKDGSRFPRSVFTVDYENSFFDSSFDTVQTMIHPTQKPVALFRYLIQMYSNPNDTIFDGFVGSGSSAIACYEDGRKFIGSELDPFYYSTACKRFAGHVAQQKLFAPSV